MQYLDFEGNIPKGEYGGGAMIVWDRGRWSWTSIPARRSRRAISTFTLDGERLHGRWHLVRMRPRPGEKKEQWLLIKAEDEFAPPGRRARDHRGGDHLGRQRPDHRGTRRARRIAQGPCRPRQGDRGRAGARLPDPAGVGGARKAILPAFLEPSLPQQTDKAPSGPEWVHEIKYDGYRMQARIDGPKVSAADAKGLDWTSRFPSIADALKDLGLSSALIDGEIVVEETTGIPSFALLQAGSERGTTATAFAISCSICCIARGSTSPRRRCSIARRCCNGSPRGCPMTRPFASASISRRTDRPCSSTPVGSAWKGSCRSAPTCRIAPAAAPHWLKTKGILRQEFVILGYVPSTAARGTVGALLVGYFDRGKLHYAGRVGTGYSADQSRLLRTHSRKSPRARPKLGNDLPAGAGKERSMGRAAAWSARSNIAAGPPTG